MLARIVGNVVIVIGLGLVIREVSKAFSKAKETEEKK